MAKPQPTSKVLKMLKDSGWTEERTTGKHAVWRSPNGVAFSIPTSHSTISPGVYRDLLKAAKKVINPT